MQLFYIGFKIYLKGTEKPFKKIFFYEFYRTKRDLQNNALKLGSMP